MIELVFTSGENPFGRQRHLTPGSVKRETWLVRYSGRHIIAEIDQGQTPKIQ